MRRLLGLLAVVLLALSGLAFAQFGYPDKPIRILVGFSPGVAPDITSRLFADRFNESWAKGVVVENVTGAGGQTGSKRVADAPPDGYNILIGTVGTHAQSQTLYKKPLYNASTDFTPVGLIAQVPILLIARKDLPVKDFKEFVAYAKANQSKMQFGSAGAGSATHLGCVLLNYMIGVDITHVPYRGTAQSMVDLMQGRIELSVSTIPPTLQQIHEGKLRALAVMGEHRNAMLPEIPTVAEAGVPGCEAGLWTAIVVPAGTPAPIVKRLNEAMLAVAAASDVQQAMKIQGVDPEPGSPEAVAERIKADVVKWKDVVTVAKIAGAQQ